MFLFYQSQIAPCLLIVPYLPHEKLFYPMVHPCPLFLWSDWSQSYSKSHCRLFLFWIDARWSPILIIFNVNIRMPISLSHWFLGNQGYIPTKLTQIGFKNIWITLSAGKILWLPGGIIWYFSHFASISLINPIGCLLSIIWRMGAIPTVFKGVMHIDKISLN